MRVRVKRSAQSGSEGGVIWGLPVDPLNSGDVVEVAVLGEDRRMVSSGECGDPNIVGGDEAAKIIFRFPALVFGNRDRSHRILPRIA